MFYHLCMPAEKQDGLKNVAMSICHAFAISVHIIPKLTYPRRQPAVRYELEERLKHIAAMGWSVEVWSGFAEGEEEGDTTPRNIEKGRYKHHENFSADKQDGLENVCMSMHEGVAVSIRVIPKLSDPLNGLVLKNELNAAFLPLSHHNWTVKVWTGPIEEE